MLSLTQLVLLLLPLLDVQCKGHRLAEEDTRWIFQQLMIGLQYCHDRVRGGVSADATTTAAACLC